jgi:hypothetical protein
MHTFYSFRKNLGRKNNGWPPPKKYFFSLYFTLFKKVSLFAKKSREKCANEQGWPNPSKISGVSTNFGLLVNVFPGPSEENACKPKLFSSWLNGQYNPPGRLVGSSYTFKKNQSICNLWCLPFKSDRWPKTHVGKAKIAFSEKLLTCGLKEGIKAVWLLKVRSHGSSVA